MQLISNGVNGNYLRNILLNAPGDIDWVKAAVAYASGTPELIDFCVDKNLPLHFWGRMDETFPVSGAILKRFLTLGPNYQCKLVWKYYHPKVIWFEGYGAYIGSANLTASAWYKNVECGVWFTQADLERQNLIPQLDLLFQQIDRVAEPLTDELYSRLKALEDQFSVTSSELTKSQNKLAEAFESRIKPTLSKKFDGLSQVAKKDAVQASKRRFFEEWNDTLQLLRKISDQVVQDQNRPAWVNADVPKGVQVDQFLHAYYYTTVKPGLRSMHQEFHEKNKGNPQVALDAALAWWKGLSAAPDEEDDFMYRRAPFLLDRLSKAKLLSMAEDDFVQVCLKIHAFVTAARQTRNVELGLPEDTKLDLIPRAEKVARWMWTQQTSNGSGPIEVLNHVLYGGPIESITERIWDATFEETWHLPRLGLSCIGEMVGWAMPDKYPPRNGRTSKALNALGFQVAVYGE